jgi:hypothetical protein
MPLIKDYYASIACIKSIGNFPLRSISHKNNEKKHLFKFYCFFFHVFFPIILLIIYSFKITRIDFL